MLKIAVILFWSLVIALLLLWQQAGLPGFRGLWITKTVLIAVASFNILVILLFPLRILKVLLAANSFAFSLLGVDLWLAYQDPVVPENQIEALETATRPRRNAFGFAKPPEQVDIVAIGDSQTWGVNVPAKLAWPAQLEQLTGKSVFNWSLGGFSPPDYLTLFRRARRIRPEIIVVGLYLGNDIWGSFDKTYKDEKYREFRTEEGSKIGDTIETEAENHWKAMKDFEQNFTPPESNRWDDLADRSALFKFVTTGIIGRPPQRPYLAQREWAIQNSHLGSFYDDGKIRTVFMTAYRLLGMDQDRAANREGLRITKEILRSMQKMAEQSQTHFLLLLIPTKEMVFHELVRNRGQMNPVYAKHVTTESRLREDIVRFCKQNGIRYVDALPALSSVVSSIQIYPHVGDGHPVAAGYQQIARAVHEEIRR